MRNGKRRRRRRRSWRSWPKCQAAAICHRYRPLVLSLPNTIYMPPYMNLKCSQACRGHQSFVIPHEHSTPLRSSPAPCPGSPLPCSLLFGMNENETLGRVCSVFAGYANELALRQMQKPKNHRRSMGGRATYIHTYVVGAGAMREHNLTGGITKQVFPLFQPAECNALDGCCMWRLHVQWTDNGHIHAGSLVHWCRQWSSWVST